MKLLQTLFSFTIVTGLALGLFVAEAKSVSPDLNNNIVGPIPIQLK